MSKVTLKELLIFFKSLVLSLLLPLTTEAVVLNGQYVTNNKIGGCNSADKNDILDQMDWAYRRVEPLDCTVQQLNTPIFSWPYVKNLVAGTTYKLEIFRDGEANPMLVKNIATNRLILNQIPAGYYRWRVSYRTSNLPSVIQVSAFRRFAIAASAISIPDANMIADELKLKGHRRGYVTDGIEINKRAKSYEYSNPMFSTIYTADKSISDFKISPILPADAPLVTLPQIGEAQYVKTILDIKNVSSKELEAIEALAHGSYFDLAKTSSFKDLAKKRVLNLARWNYNGMSSELINDQANRNIFLALATGINLLYEEFTPAERQIIYTSLSARIDSALNVFDKLLITPYDNHPLEGGISYALEAMIYVLGKPDYPQGRDRNQFIRAWNLFFTSYGAWGGSIDGGYGNGDGYGWYNQGSTRIFAILKLALNLDLTQWPSFGKAGLNQIAMTIPNKAVRSQFGDAATDTTLYAGGTSDNYRLYSSLNRNNEAYAWYWRVNPNNPIIFDNLNPLHYLLLGWNTTFKKPAVAPASLQNSFLFEDAGIVAAHTNTGAPDRTSLFFRSSRFGSYNHSHADNNSFTFFSKGEPMLISGGEYPYFLAPTHKKSRATRFKNAITFDNGVGQAEPVYSATNPVAGDPMQSMEARGKLVNYFENSEWTVSTGDATKAYQGYTMSTYKWTPYLTNAVRTVMFNRVDKVAIIYDWATSDTARKWELNFATPVMPGIDSATRIKVINNNSKICIDMFNLNGSFPTSTGAVASAFTPVQYFTKYAAKNASKELATVTLITEDCKTPSWWKNPVVVGTKITINYNGKLIVLDKATVDLQE
jgi:hypothetical protein